METMDDENSLFVREKVFDSLFIFRFSELGKWSAEPLIKTFSRVENAGQKEVQ